MKRLQPLASLSLLVLQSGACASDPAAPTTTDGAAGNATTNGAGGTATTLTGGSVTGVATATTGTVGSVSTTSSASSGAAASTGTATGATGTTLGMTATSSDTTATTGSSGTMGGSGGSGGTGNLGGTSTGATGAGGTGIGGTGGGAAFELTSPGLESGADCSADMRDSCAYFDPDNTSFGADESPPFSWTAGPAGTQSYALVMQDLVYMPQGEPFAHWILWNIPASVTSLPAALEGGNMPSEPAGASQVSFKQDNSFAGSGGCGNVYEFILLALSVPSVAVGSMDSDAVRDALLDSADILASATLRARSGPEPCN